MSNYTTEDIHDVRHVVMPRAFKGAREMTSPSNKIYIVSGMGNTRTRVLEGWIMSLPLRLFHKTLSLQS